MKEKTCLKTRFFSALFAVFFSILSIFAFSSPVFAVKDETTPIAETSETDATETSIDTCSDQAGTVAWIVCPVTKAIANAIDSLYSAINNIIVVDPISADANSPIHLVWQYARDLTNIVFIIILLIVVYSQLTGLGLNNFGIKRILPRLIVAAILVNLSWYICALAIDLSNIIGTSLRGLFAGIKETALAAGTIPSTVTIDWSSILGVIVTGGTVAGLSIAAAGGLGAFFWMLIPILLGAIVAVIAGLITVAARQAIVAFLVMISPLAFVAYLIPNTEKWFEKWKQTLYKMLIFFPMFSFLYGASDLIGWTVVASAIKGTEVDGFGLLLGMAIQVFPLFFGFSLMKMSGTILGSVNNAIRKISAPAQKSVGNFSNKQRELKRQKYLGGEAKTHQLGRRFAQRISDLDTRRAADTKTYAQTAEERGKAFASRYKTRRGNPTRRGENLYSTIEQRLQAQADATRNAAEFDAGIFAYAGSESQKRRLRALDFKNRDASDRLKYEQDYAAKVTHNNAVQYFERTRRATMSHIDPNAIVEGKEITAEDHARYQTMLNAMHGNPTDTLYIDANAAYSYSAQNRIVTSKFSELFDTAAPTQQLVDILQHLTTSKDAAKYIDSIVSGFRSLNMRGDTDITNERVEEITRKLATDLYADGGIKLGTHASQSLASFCMFDVKDNDPILRRFGKFINLETAHVYNRRDDPNYDPRHNLNVTFEEYVKGEYQETADDGKTLLYNPDGTPLMRPVNKDMVTLLKGTSYAHVERTAFENQLQSIRRAYTDENGNTDIAAFEAKLKQLNNSILPNVISDVLGYASGSEQIVSFAQYLTGMKQSKNGEWKKLWEDTQNKGFYGIPMDYFINLTETYIRSQVPNQIASFKSDIFGNVRSLFRTKSALDYESTTGISRNDKYAEFLTEAGYDPIAIAQDNSPEAKKAKTEAEEKVDNFYDNLTTENNGVAGAIQHFRDSLGTDVFIRLQNSARSGALNNAKGPVIKWLGIKFDNNKKKKEEQQPTVDEDDESIEQHSFTESLRQNLTGTFMNLHNSSNSPHDYYTQAMQLLNDNNLDETSQALTDYYNNNMTVTTDDLHNYLIDLIKNI